jgi:hypothetical protein
VEYRLDVERTLDNRLKLDDWQDQSPLAWEEHRRRAAVLHELFDDDGDWRVTDWGDTEDQERTHELVRLALEWLQQAGPGIATFVALDFGKTALAEVEKSALAGIRRLIKRLVRRQVKKEVGPFTLFLPNGGHVGARPPGEQPPYDVVRMFGSDWVEVPIGQFTEEN